MVKILLNVLCLLSFRTALECDKLYFNLSSNSTLYYESFLPMMHSDSTIRLVVFDGGDDLVPSSFYIA